MTNLTQSISSDALPLKWIQYLFEQMSMMYGRKFTDQWGGTDPEKLQAFWAKELSGFSRDELSRGYKALETREWPPTLPEFKKLCRPPVDPLVAYYEAVSGVQARERGEIGEWSHPAIYWASTKIGAFDLKNQGYSVIKARWEKALGDELNAGVWSAIPAPLLALPDSGKASLSREEAEKRVKELQAVGITKTVSAAVDHRLWAKRILKREKEGDKTLTLIQKKFAREAMEIKDE